MTRYAVAYVATFIIFLGIDAVWLTTMSQRLYRQYLGDVLAENFSPVPAVVFYLLYVVGMLIFALSPAFATGKWTTAALYGALFGFFAYATYDLTSHATIRGWPAIITVVDICWGTLVTSVSAALAFIVVQYFYPQT